MKYLTLFSARLKASMAYRADTLLGALLSFFRVLLSYLLWRMLVPDGGQLNGFTLPEMVTYSVLTTALAPLNANGRAVNAFADDIRTGRFARHLTAPVQPFGVFAASSLAMGLPPFLLTAACCLIWGALFSGMMAPVSAWGVARALPVLTLGVLFNLLLNYLLACLAFRFTEVYGLVMIKETAMEFLCGYLAPLEVLLGFAPLRLPLYYLAGYPVLLMMGRAPAPPALGALVLTLWALGLGALCAVVSRRSRRYFEGVGA